MKILPLVITLFALFLLTACMGNTSAPLPKNNVDEISTIVAATLSAIPSTTLMPTLSDVSVPTATSTVIAPPEPLNRSDFLSVVKWVSFSLTQKQPGLIADLIGQNGVNWAKYRSGMAYLGYNNEELFVAELGKGLQDASPQCLGYEYSVGTLPDKGSIIYRNINLDWNKLFGLDIVPEEGDMISFGFHRLEDGWELVVLVFMRAALWGEVSTTLFECP